MSLIFQKKYCRELRRSLWYGLRDIAGELSLSGAPGNFEGLRQAEFWALKDVSFKHVEVNLLQLSAPMRQEKVLCLKCYMV